MKTILLTLILSLGVSAQVIVPGNPNCNSLGFTSEFKVEPPNAGTYNVVGVGTITYTRNSPTTLSWTSSSPAFVRAAIMKAGGQANVYYYTPASLGADLLNTGSQNALSHISFCYNLTPTAAHVEVSGKVTDFYGRPISRARVVVTDLQNGESKSAITNPFGYYTVGDLEVGNLYQVSATAKGYEFIPLILNLKDSVTGYDIVANY